METAELLQRYRKGEREFCDVDLRNQNFQDAQLPGVDFSRADIRSANFNHANLAGTSFLEAKAGLDNWASLRLITCIISITFFAGILASLSGYFVGFLIVSEEYFESYFWIDYFVDLVVYIFLFFLFKRDLLPILGGIIAATAILAILAVTLTGTLTGNIFAVLLTATTVAGAGILPSAIVFAVAGALMLTVTEARLSVIVTAIFLIGLLSLSITSSADLLASLGLSYGSIHYSGNIEIHTSLITSVEFVSTWVGCRSLRKIHEKGNWIPDVAVMLSTIGSTSFRKAVMTDADFSGANLKSTDLREASMIRTSWHNTRNLHLSRTKNTILVDSNVRKLVVTHHGSEKTYEGCNLEGANLFGADLSGANLTGANISEATLELADLERVKLIRTEALGANLFGCKLTGACLESWNIDASTRLDKVDCKFVYLLKNQKERRPNSEESTFAAGEFTRLFEEVLNTIDLIFRDGVDWQAFFQSFQELRSQYDGANLSIQAIEKKKDGAFVIRLEVPLEENKAEIEARAKQLYETQIKALEARYEKQLRLQGSSHLEDLQQVIEAERRDKAVLMKVFETMADNQQGPKYDMRGAQFAGGFAETVQGDQVGGTQHNYAAPEKQDLAETALEIQRLLKQLEETNSTATESEQRAFVTASIPPTLRQRAVGALQSGGKAAVEELLDNPYVNVAISVIEGWKNVE